MVCKKYTAGLPKVKVKGLNNKAKKRKRKKK